MKEGDVILVPLPQADGLVKNRPAIVLREMPPFNDFLVCGVSSQLYQEVKGFDEVITETDSDFSESGLLSASLVRLGFLAVVPRKAIAGAIGKISSERHARLLKKLSDHLIQKALPTAATSL